MQSEEIPSAPLSYIEETLAPAGWVAQFLPHLLALLFPLNALAFVLSGPHRGWRSVLFLLPIVVSGIWDARGGRHERQPREDVPAWPFDGLLVVLAVLQLANVVLFARMVHANGALGADALVGIAVVGSSSGYSGIVVAHELIHRLRRGWVSLGRLLLCTVMYEHFYTEHVRGHHVRVGTDEDPATARFGESFVQFYVRTVPAQFRSAWRLEAQRLGDAAMPCWDRRLLRSRVVHGVVAELGLAAMLGVCFGPVALVAYLLQALWATGALEVVNYFEHWGLRRVGHRVLPVHSWDTHSRFTYYALTGLSRHADHHAYSARPYRLLRVWNESPKLPRGYLAMFPLVLGRNDRFRCIMTERLRRKKLGPFAEGA